MILFFEKKAEQLKIEPRPTKDTALYVTFCALSLTGLFAISNNTVYCSFKAKQLHFKNV